MATDAEGRVSAGNGYGVLEGGACRHEGGGRENSRLVKFDDGTIDAGGEAEVVCVDDEAGGHDFGLEEWWAERDSNPRHPACKAGALTN